MPRKRVVHPSEAELRTLYLDQGLSASALAQRYDVSKVLVLRWLRAHGIPVRPPGASPRAPAADRSF